jgi:hypothetical protein
MWQNQFSAENYGIKIKILDALPDAEDLGRLTSAVGETALVTYKSPSNLSTYYEIQLTQTPLALQTQTEYNNSIKQTPKALYCMRGIPRLTI